MRLQIIETLDSFRQLRENHAYYVDKTQVLKEYLVDNFKTAVLFARPHPVPPPGTQVHAVHEPE